MKAHRSIFGMALLVIASALLLLSIIMCWTMRDGMGPDSVESHGMTAVLRFLKEVWLLVVLILPIVALGAWMVRKPKPSIPSSGNYLPEGKGDWRLTNQEAYLKGATLRLRRFSVRAGQPDWDHDHCEFCWTKIAEKNRKQPGDDLRTEAYATEDGCRWVCPQCFFDFKERFQWKVIT